MSEHWSNQDEQWEQVVQQTAKGMEYPPTPAMTRAKQSQIVPVPRRFPTRRLAQIAAVLLIVFAVMFSVPEIRAAILDAIRIGVVTIFLGGEPTPTETIEPTAGALQPTRRPTSTPRPEPTPLQSVFDLPGEQVTLDEARAATSFPLRLPTYPPDLGEPDVVLLHRLPAAFVSLIWYQPDNPDEIRMLLQILNEDAVASKFYRYNGQNLIETTVKNQEAIWLPDAHEQVFYQIQTDLRRQVYLPTLIWQTGLITYRLEINATMEEAILIAESLQ
jgi:hypothetical protein